MEKICQIEYVNHYQRSCPRIRWRFIWKKRYKIQRIWGSNFADSFPILTLNLKERSRFGGKEEYGSTQPSEWFSWGDKFLEIKPENGFSVMKTASPEQRQASMRRCIFPLTFYYYFIYLDQLKLSSSDQLLYVNNIEQRPYKHTIADEARSGANPLNKKGDSSFGTKKNKGPLLLLVFSTCGGRIMTMTLSLNVNYDNCDFDCSGMANDKANKNLYVLLKTCCNPSRSENLDPVSAMKHKYPAGLHAYFLETCLVWFMTVKTLVHGNLAISQLCQQNLNKRKNNSVVERCKFITNICDPSIDKEGDNHNPSYALYLLYYQEQLYMEKNNLIKCREQTETEKKNKKRMAQKHQASRVADKANQSKLDPR